ncbi:hypothetical protein M197_gp68 [Haloarcula hispanica tailed virus 2]|uniref:Uncharacterized protein n=1 Tax=Haloarcula hispanica tailed virus 2 TaxID=1273751 RepID=R4TKN2_9CAUD|nr:hypothetical protein M197_gp68 [Haloarcula hispanica tailed virus 2]AGM11232.1 hypothetical protein HHTV2_67 [Haloarcula hispanica tailed virus 2]
MTETVIEAFERLARDLLESPELSVQHTREPSVPIGGTGAFEIDERTEIQVTHYGEPEALEELEDRHGDAIMSSWYVETQDLSAGTGSSEPMLVSEAEFVLGCDPYDEYVSGGAGGAVSASSSTGSATTSEATDGHEDEQDAPDEPEYPEPSREMSEEGGGIRHVLAAEVPGEEDRHVCGTPIGEAEYEGSVRDLYDDLLGAIADPMLCDDCEDALAHFYGIPKDKVHERREDQYG